MNNTSDKGKKNEKKWESLPNEFHRKERWKRQNVVKSKKTYSRKRKHRKADY